jgi:predicted Zn-dependent protease
MKDPMKLVAVIAHELGHVILLRSELVDREEADMEPLNDLLTVFLGQGIRQQRKGTCKGDLRWGSSSGLAYQVRSSTS